MEHLPQTPTQHKHLALTVGSRIAEENLQKPQWQRAPTIGTLGDVETDVGAKRGCIGFESRERKRARRATNPAISE